MVLGKTGRQDKQKTPHRLTDGYKRYIRSKIVFLVVVLLLLILLIVAAASTGAIPIPFGNVVSILVQRNTEGLGRIVWDVRMPRIIAAVLAGAGLSLGGTVMQSVLKNPLASPYTLGISSAAAFGASFAIVFLQAGTSSSTSIVIHSPYIVSIAAFAFSLLAAAAILMLAGLTRISAESLVLAGIAIGAMFSAGLTLMQYLADSVQLANIISWTFGDLGRANWRMLAIILGVLVPVYLLFLYYRWDFNAMDAGEEAAKGLGVHTSRVRITGMIGASLVSAVIVSFFGIISFIGLLGPHIAKRFIGGDHRYGMVASPLIGASVLLAADTAARTVLAPMVLPVGILTSMLGGPLFIYLLMRRSGR